jgi:hypothetical protein
MAILYKLRPDRWKMRSILRKIHLSLLLRAIMSASWPVTLFLSRQIQRQLFRPRLYSGSRGVVVLVGDHDHHDNAI